MGRWRGIPPQRAMIGTALIAAACVVLAVKFATDVRWFGVELAPAEHGVQVIAVAPDGPAAGALAPDDRIVGVRGADGVVAVNGESLTADPDMLFTYARYDAFFAQQQQLYAVAAGAQTTLVLADGREITVQPTTERPLRELTAEFWILLAFSVVVAQIGFGMWAFRSDRMANAMIALTALGFALGTGTFAIYGTREWLLDASLFRTLAELNHLGNIAFGFTALVLVVYYPRRLTRLPIAPLCAAAVIVLWLNELAQFIAWPSNTFHFPYFIPYVLGMWAAWAQWRATRQRADERAALKWFLLSVLMSIGVVMLLYFVPELFGEPPLLPPAVGQLMLCGLFVGLVLGVLRFRLFDLERWWFAAWLWFVGGVLVVVADLALMYVANMQPLGALSLAIIIVGWLYFPVRQWLWRRLVRSPSLQMEAYLPLLLEAFFSANTAAEFDARWQWVLKRVFDPLDVRLAPGQCAAAALEQNGMVLAVPDLAGDQRHVELSGRSRGERLFTREDVQLAALILALARKSAGLRAAQERGANLERERIARDLHDDVAPQLLTLIHRATTAQNAEGARNALQTLRESIYALNDPRDEPLDEVIAAWRRDTADRTEAAKVALEWRQPDAVGPFALSSRQRLNLARVLREGVTNALRHAGPTQIGLAVTVDAATLTVRLLHDGAIAPLDQWRSGNGTTNMRTRIAELNGQIEWQLGETEGAPRLAVIWSAPLSPMPAPVPAERAAEEA